MAKDISGLSERTGVVIFARVVTTIIDLSIVIATIQILSKTDFAIIGYLLMIHEIARNIATLGFPESIFYFFERISGSSKRGFVVQTVFILLFTALISGLLILLISFVLPSFLTEWGAASVGKVQYLLPFMALVVLFEIPTWPVTNILLASDKQKQSAWFELITSLLTFILLIGPLALGYGLEIAVYGLVIYGIIRFAGSMIWMNLVLPEGKLSDSEITVRQQINFSLPLGFSALVNKVNRYVDKFIVSILLPISAYAEYNIAAQEVPIIRVIPFAVGSVLISRYVSLQLESKKEELLSLWYKGIQKVSLLVLPLTILSIVVAPDLISLIAESDGTSYQNAIIPFQIYNLIVLLRVTHYGSILQAFGDTKGVMYLSINLVVANVILSIPLTLLWGVNGTALSTLLANVYNWFIMLRRIGKHIELPFYKVLPFPFYFHVLAVAIITAIPVWISRWYMITESHNLIGLIWSIPVYLILFGAIGTFSGAIEKRDWKELKEWLQLKFFR